MADVTVTIKYWIAGSDEYPLYYRENGVQKGAYEVFLEKMDSAEDITLERVSDRDGVPVTQAEALMMLQSGDIDMVIGIPEDMPGADTTGLTASHPVYANELTAVIAQDSPQVPADSVDTCYWGIEQDYIGMTEGTALEEHVLDFNSRDELFEALDNKSIYGAVVKKSSLDNAAYVSRHFSYRHCPVISFKFNECVYTRTADKELTAAVDSVCSELAKKYLKGQNVGENGLSDPLPADGYINLIADSYRANTRLTVIACAGVFCTLFFGILAAVFSSKYKKQKERERLKMATFVADNPAKELYELDIRKKELYAYDGFSVFGSLPADMPNPISLEKLSVFLGYDFVEHFSGVTLHGNTIFHNRLILHKGGEKLYISEDGHRVGDVLFFTMTNVREDEKTKSR